MEGPSIVILKEEVLQFRNKTVIGVRGNSKIDQKRILNQKVIEFKSWGKHFLICFKDFTLRIHFLMFGSYKINAEKSQPVRLSLQFENGQINLYTCSIKFIEGDLKNVYDWEVDVMSKNWNPRNAVTALRKLNTVMLCDALLDQQIFAGSGNIIKNEVLFRVKLHPESLVSALSLSQLKLLVSAVKDYSFDFYRWKKIYQLKKNWLIYTKKKCPRCNLLVIKKYTGETKRRSFFCSNCQLLLRRKLRAKNK